VAEVALITSLRDGMNLVVRNSLVYKSKKKHALTDGCCEQALEYVSCQEKKNGVLILSEFAGVRTLNMPIPMTIFITVFTPTGGPISWHFIADQSVEEEGYCTFHREGLDYGCRFSSYSPPGTLQLCAHLHGCFMVHFNRVTHLMTLPTLIFVRSRGESFVNALQNAAEAHKDAASKLKKSPDDYALVLEVQLMFNVLLLLTQINYFLHFRVI